MSRAHGLHLCCVPLPLNCPTTPPSQPGQNPRASLTFSLPFTSGTQHPAGSSLHIAPKPAVKTVRLDLEPNGNEPNCHSSARFHGILSPSSVLELSHSRLRSWLQVSFCDPCLGFEEPPVLLTWHSSHWVGGLAVGGPCPLLSLLPWAPGLMHNRCSANICRMIVDADWELCTKCLAKWVARTISLDKSRIGEPSRRWWLAKSNQLASTRVRVVERSRWIPAVCAVCMRGAGGEDERESRVRAECLAWVTAASLLRRGVAGSEPEYVFGGKLKDVATC